MKNLALVLFLLSFQNSYGQEISCTDLHDFIVDNGYRKSSIGSYSLGSSWLHEVTAYEYDYRTYVVAKIKPSEYSYVTKSYVFCAIPSSNWNLFKHGSYGNSDSYGQRFHQYIMEYKCNCY